MNNSEVTWDVAVGIDWADAKHDYALDDGSLGEFPNTPEGIHTFIAKVRAKYAGKRIAICLEQAHGSLIYALLEFDDLVLFPINPAQLANFRKSIYPSGKIDDPSDAALLMELLQQHGDRLRPCRPDTPQVRSLATLAEHRRTFVDQRTKLVLKLQAALKKYYPVALQMSDNYSSPLLLDLLIKWPTLKKLQHQKDSYLEKFFRAHNCRNAEKIQERIQVIRDAKPLTTDSGVLLPQSMLVQQLVKLLRELQKTITVYDREIAKSVAQNDEAILFGKIRGVGPQLAPRLATAFGTNRERYQNAGEIQAYSGIAPVTRRSGKKHRVTRRYACPKFLRQTFHEFAEQMRKYSTWSKAYYESQRERGKTHHVAVRALAFKWIRILYAVWKTGIPYDEESYIQQLKNRNSPLAKRLSENSTQTA